MASPSEFAQPFQPGELFPQTDPLADVTAEDVGPEIAAALGLPSSPPPAQPDRPEWTAPAVATDPPWTLTEAANLTSKLLERCRAWILCYVVVSDEQAVIMAAWTLHTYVFEVAESTPYIHITAPEKACGKSRLMEVLEALAAHPKRSGGITPAALTRCIDSMTPTIFLDEMDAQLSGNKEYAENIRGILNEGFRKGGKFLKCDGKNNDLREFNAYCPKCFAGIGKLPDTVASRSIAIEMRRKLPGEKVEPFRQREVKAAALPLKTALDAWKARGAESLLEKIQPAPIASLIDRQNDIAEPLLCIAQLAGDGWLGRLTAALLIVFNAASREDGSNGATLLADIRTVFDERKADNIPSKDLAERLCEIEGRPWAEWNHGKPMSANNLARQLKKHHINSLKIRFGSETAQGYGRGDFEDAWSRYCPIPPSQTEQPEQAASSLNETPFSQTEHKRNISPANGTFTRTAPVADVPFVPDVPDVPFCSVSVPFAKSASNPHEQRRVPVVPFQTENTPKSEVRI